MKRTVRIAQARIIPLVVLVGVLVLVGSLSTPQTASAIHEAEPTLQEVLDAIWGTEHVIVSLGNSASDAMVVPPGSYIVTLIAEHTDSPDATIGKYAPADTGVRFPFLPPEAGPLAQVEMVADLEVGLFVDHANFGTWTSDPAHNAPEDDFDHFVVVDVPASLGGGFVVGIEIEEGGGDKDFQDHVLYFRPEQ